MKKKEKLKKVSELAAELGITRQALDKRMRKSSLSSQLKMCGGIVMIGKMRYITPNGEKMIRMSYKEEPTMPFDERTNNLYHFNASLMSENKRLKKELEELKSSIRINQLMIIILRKRMKTILTTYREK